MRGIYLCSRKHRIPGYDIVYNDIVAYPGIDIVSDCLTIDFESFDYIIASPPCNYYSRANWRRETSLVALETKDILPKVIERCILSKKPFIVENVVNKSLLPCLEDCFWFEFGNHIFYTNIMMTKFKLLGVKPKFQNKQYVSREKRDGNWNVDVVFKAFVEVVEYLAKL